MAVFQEHGVEDVAYDTNHPFLYPTHMRTMSGIELPLALLVCEVAIHLHVVATLLVDLKLPAGTHKLGATIQSELLHRASDGKETPERIDEALCIHGLEHFDVDLPCTHASEDEPIFWHWLDHLEFFATSPTKHKGLNTSSPTYVKGGSACSRSAGKSAMICSSCFPRSLQQVTQLKMMLLIALSPLAFQNLAALMAPSVKCLPW